MKKSLRQTIPGLNFRRIVVKLGTRLLTDGKNHLDETALTNLVSQVSRLHKKGAEMVIISSGAIASGRDRLGLIKSVKGAVQKQALAAIGQGRLINTYEKLFGAHDIVVAQALLTRSDLAKRAGYLNARNTLLSLIDLRVICIVNENDVISIEEIKENKFGDNDNLSAMVANLVDADLLMILTDIDGLFTADPTRDPGARLISQIDKIDASIKKMGKATRSDVGTGGMVTKIEAAALATSSGVHVVIANGNKPDVIERIACGESIGTHFPPVTSNLESRERWMLSGLCTRGKLIVDAGAALALSSHNRSLLAAGVRAVDGKFSRGDIVAIYDHEKNHIGCGITNYSSSDISIIKGSRSGNIGRLLSTDYGPEVVHKNNLALLNREGTSGHRQTATIL